MFKINKYRNRIKEKNGSLDVGEFLIIFSFLILIVAFFAITNEITSFIDPNARQMAIHQKIWKYKKLRIMQTNQKKREKNDVNTKSIDNNIDVDIKGDNNTVIINQTINN